MNEKLEEHYRELAWEVKRYIVKNRDDIPEGDKVLIPYYKRNHERATKEIFHEILGDDISYCEFMREKPPRAVREMKHELIFLIAFMVYMVFVTVIMVSSIVFDIDNRFLSFLTYMGNVGGLVCGYMVFKSAMQLKRISFLLLAIFIFILNGFNIYRQIVEWGLL